MQKLETMDLALLTNLGYMCTLEREAASNALVATCEHEATLVRKVANEERDVALVTAELQRRGFHDIGHARSVLAGQRPMPQPPKEEK